MTIATTLRSYLDSKSIRYALAPHAHTGSSMDTAASAHVPGDRLAKGVIVQSDEETLMVVVPSDYHVHLGLLHRHLGREVGLATEPELAELFPDCEPGAVPALGQAYGLRTLLDSNLLGEPEVYLEAGDHETLIRLAGEDFRALMADAEQVDVGQHI
ncbi:MAG: aminoacyl-tRNA deacylase [Bdellovibrio bacteriovorus]